MVRGVGPPPYFTGKNMLRIYLVSVLMLIFNFARAILFNIQIR